MCPRLASALGAELRLLGLNNGSQERCGRGPLGSGSQCDGRGRGVQGVDVLVREPSLPQPGGLGPSLFSPHPTTPPP